MELKTRLFLAMMIIPMLVFLEKNDSQTSQQQTEIIAREPPRIPERPTKPTVAALIKVLHKCGKQFFSEASSTSWQKL